MAENATKGDEVSQRVNKGAKVLGCLRNVWKERSVLLKADGNV